MKPTGWMRAGAAALALGATADVRAAQAPETEPLEVVPNEQDVDALESAEATAPAVEPEALDALHRMGNYLRTLETFSVRADSTLDEVTDDGMKLQFAGTLSGAIRRPDRFVLEVDTDRKHRRFTYDGKSLTMYDTRGGYYTTIPAPPTIRETLDEVSDRYDIQLPLMDLFSWGEDPSSEQAIREAAIIGPSDVKGVTCDHVAVRQENVDWQVWIQQGDRPLPRRIVITTLSDPQQPQYTATLTWNTDPKFTPSTFLFTPPSNAHKIDIERPEASGEQGQEESP